MKKGGSLQGALVEVRGKTIRLPVQYQGYYTKKQYLGRTVYQHIFERILARKPISLLALTEEFRQVFPNIADSTVLKMIRRVVTGVRASKDSRISDIPVSITRRGGDRRSSSWQQKALKNTRQM